MYSYILYIVVLKKKEQNTGFEKLTAIVIRNYEVLPLCQQPFVVLVVLVGFVCFLFRRFFACYDIWFLCVSTKTHSKCPSPPIQSLLEITVPSANSRFTGPDAT